MPVTGKIVSPPLAGVRCELIRRTPAGVTIVKLLEPRGAYQVGDVVHLGTGDFRKD